MPKPLHVYADVETDSLRAQLLLQIAAVGSEESQFSVYINPYSPLPASCTQITGLYYHQNQLYRNGRILPSVPIKAALLLFKKWVESLGSVVHLVFHNGFAFDAQVLVKHFDRQGIEFPANVAIIHDTLPLFKKALKNEKEIENFKLASLAKHTLTPLDDAHNAISDAKCLKEICENYTQKQGIDLGDFLNIYKKSIQHFKDKSQKQKIK